MKLRTLATVLLSVYALIVTVVTVSSATASDRSRSRAAIVVGKPVTAKQVEALLSRYVNEKEARRSDLAVVRFVLDSTNDAALEQPCGFDRNGNLLSAEGDQAEADMVGKVTYAPTASERAAAERKLSKHMGFCYLGVSTSVGGVTKIESARTGAVKRIALALSKLAGNPVKIVDGKRSVTYNW